MIYTLYIYIYQASGYRIDGEYQIDGNPSISSLFKLQLHFTQPSGAQIQIWDSNNCLARSYFEFKKKLGSILFKKTLRQSCLFRQICLFRQSCPCRQIHRSPYGRSRTDSDGFRTLEIVKICICFHTMSIFRLLYL